MPIQLPDLDNKTFAELMDEMTASIPKYTNEWTNFNPSDPGMAILELLAWISESLIYRANRVSEDANLNFLRLVAGDSVFDDTDKAHKRINEYLSNIDVDRKAGLWKPDVEAMKAEAQNFLKSRYRAVTEEDFRELAKEAAPDEIIRVEVFTQAKSIEIVIIPSHVPVETWSLEFCSKVTDYLYPRRLIGTALKVHTAVYTPVALSVQAVSFSYVEALDVEREIKKALMRFLDPVKGGALGNGWPYGRDVMVYELINIVEKVPGVKMVQAISSDKPFPIKIEGLVDTSKVLLKVSVKGEHEDIAS